MFDRILKFLDLGKESCFLWGPRQTGKSTLLKKLFPHSLRYDLLNTITFERLNLSPSLMAQEVLKSPLTSSQPIIIDEVQKIPRLLDEVQRLMVDHAVQFVLCGSSARKLKRGGGNLLGGRAIRYELFPLVYPEIPQFDLLRALNHGLIPRHYLAKRPFKLSQAYVGEYLKEEILAEALTRRIESFHRFLEAAAITNGEIVNYQNVASDCGVSAPTVREYYQILVDTLLGRFLPSFQKRPKRKVIQAPKFYYFDVGVINFLLKRRFIEVGSETFGRAFEHFIFQEIMAHRHYSGIDYPVFYWRTTSSIEVDFILGDLPIALEVKGVTQVMPKHLKGLQAFSEEYPTAKLFVVSLDERARKIGNITIYPWREFLELLWGGKVL